MNKLKRILYWFASNSLTIWAVYYAGRTESPNVTRVMMFLLWAQFAFVWVLTPILTLMVALDCFDSYRDKLAPSRAVPGWINFLVDLFIVAELVYFGWTAIGVFYLINWALESWCHLMFSAAHTKANKPAAVKQTA